MQQVFTTYLWETSRFHKAKSENIELFRLLKSISGFGRQTKSIIQETESTHQAADARFKNFAHRAGISKIKRLREAKFSLEIKAAFSTGTRGNVGKADTNAVLA